MLLRLADFHLFPPGLRCRDDASQKHFSWFSDWIQKVQEHVNLVDLVKSFPMSTYNLLAKLDFDTAENEPFKLG